MGVVIAVTIDVRTTVLKDMPSCIIQDFITN